MSTAGLPGGGWGLALWLAAVISSLAPVSGAAGGRPAPAADGGRSNQEWAAVLFLPAVLFGVRDAPRAPATDVMLVVDTSSDAGTTAVRAAKLAARRFLGTLGHGSRVGIVSAGGRPRVVLPLTDNLIQAHRALSLLRAGGSRELGRGVTLATDELVDKRRGTGAGQGIVVLTTVAEEDWPAGAKRAADRARGLGVTVLAPRLRTVATPRP